MKESDLYLPVKAFLEAQGYVVKAEIGPADVMAIREGDPPVIVELKTALNLNLILQGVARQALFADVYLAVPQPTKWTHRYRDLIALLRRLGLGLLTVKGTGSRRTSTPAPTSPAAALRAPAGSCANSSGARATRTSAGRRASGG